KKKTEITSTGGGSPPAEFTPAEELALEVNKGCPVIEGIEGGGGILTNYASQHKVVGDTVLLLEPLDMPLDPGEGTSATREEDEETVSVCSRRPETLYKRFL
ncbi:uncharacterized protein LOC128545477 isoform X3, partial [Scomber scombrus]